MPQQNDTPTPGAGLIKLIGGSAAVLLVGTVAVWEGKSNDPYKDIVGVVTVCYGETNTVMRSYTDAECGLMLSKSLEDYAKPVLARNPELRDRPEMLAAAISLSYNIGNANYKRSTVARRFSARDWKRACEAFLMWSKAGGQTVRGLVRRRTYERDLCLRGVK